MNTELIAILAVLLITVLGFLGMIIMMLQLNNQVKSEVRAQFRELKAEISDLSRKVETTNLRIDRLYDIVNDLYRELFKKDAA